MKFRYIFIPTILLTILVVGICKYYYDIDLLSIDSAYKISIISFASFFTIFFGIYSCAREASKFVVGEYYKHLDQYLRFLAQHIDKCFTEHKELTKNIIKQESLGNLRELKKLISIFNERDEQRTKAITNLLVNEAIERLDNVLICLRENDVEEKNVENKE